MTTALSDAPVAELDRRFYAFAIDRAIAWSAYALAGVLAWRVFFTEGRVLPGLLLLLVVVALVSVLTAVAVGASGVSPGRSAMGLRVVDADTGAPIGVGRALLRGLVLGAATLPMFGLGTATLAWTAAEDRTRARRGWHDLVTGSLVVDVRPRPVAEVVADERPRHVVNLTAMRLMPVRQPEPPPVPARLPRPETPAAATPASSATRAAPPPPTPAVTRWRVTFDSGESLVVEGLGLVGRGPQPQGDETVRHLVPLQSDDMSISKTHAQFDLAADGALVVMDRGSTNGSILVRSGVSRELSSGRPATLLDGDRVLFGDRAMSVSREAP